MITRGFNQLFCVSYRKLRESASSFSEFREYIKYSIPRMNHENESLLRDMYNRYVEYFESIDKTLTKLGRLPALVGSWFGFDGRSTALQFYLDRGWDLDTSRAMLKERQRVGAVDAIMKRKGISAAEAKKITAAAGAKGADTLRKRADYTDICYRKGNSNRYEHYLAKLNPITGELFTELEARAMVKEKQSRGYKSFWASVRNGDKVYAGTNTLEYYKRRGMCVTDAKASLRKRQCTRSLDFMISKYGEEVGTERFHLANERWLATLDAKTDEEKRDILIKKVQQGNKFFSKWSQDMISDLLTLLKLNSIDVDMSPDNCCFGDNEYFIYDSTVKRVFFYDLIFRKERICVEFNGSHVHPNREALDDTQWEKWTQPFTKESAQVCFQRDKIKIESAQRKEFEVFIVWDSDNKESKFLEILKKFKEKK